MKANETKITQFLEQNRAQFIIPKNKSKIWTVLSSDKLTTLAR